MPNGWAGGVGFVLQGCCRKGAIAQECKGRALAQLPTRPNQHFSAYLGALRVLTRLAQSDQGSACSRAACRSQIENCNSRERFRTIDEAAIQLSRRPDRIPPFSRSRTLRAFPVRISGSFRHERPAVGRSLQSIGRTADWRGLRMSPSVLRHMQKPNALTKKT